MRPRRWARRVERYCCNTITYFPLLFVYGLTSWAAWVEIGIGFNPSSNLWTGKLSSALGLVLYLALNWSYTTAVFTDPGSPLNLNNGYSHLPTQEGGGIQYTSFTVKASDGGVRFCNKCQSNKPDRAHHCSTCRRCVLKMDHHCPWLATCVGLRNYKSFLLFLIYLTLFCWVSFAASATWVWSEILSDSQYTETFMPINYVLLAVLSGIIGIVITGFTAWHLWLTVKGQTTIESLEKTRYLSPLKKTMKHNLNDRNYLDAQAHGRLSISDQLREIHANALPGVTRPEEGETPSRSPAPDRTHSSTSNGFSHSYQHRERQQNQDRYDNYLDERDNEELPNAFDLGWRRNLEHVFGPSPLRWFIPLQSTIGDGWSWEASPKWLAARERIARNREVEEQQQKQRERAAGWGVDSPTEAEFRRVGRVAEGWQPPRPTAPSPRITQRPGWAAPAEPPSRFLHATTTPAYDGRRSPSKADQILGRENGMYADGDVPLQTMDRRKFDQYSYISEDDDEDDDYETSSDDVAGGATTTTITNTNTNTLTPAAAARRSHITAASATTTVSTHNWNDIPDGFLDNGQAKNNKEKEKKEKKKGEGWDEWK
jgi:hypothetical protein